MYKTCDQAVAHFVIMILMDGIIIEINYYPFCWQPLGQNRMQRSYYYYYLHVARLFSKCTVSVVHGDRIRNCLHNKTKDVKFDTKPFTVLHRPQTSSASFCSGFHLCCVCDLVLFHSLLNPATLHGQ